MVYLRNAHIFFQKGGNLYFIETGLLLQRLQLSKTNFNEIETPSRVRNRQLRKVELFYLPGF